MIVGIDVSKDKLDIYVSTTKKHYQIKNSLASIKSFMKNKIDTKLINLVVFEATGGYEKLLQTYLIGADLPYHKAHASRVHKFAESKGRFAKTHRIDALILSLYGEQPEIKADGHKDQKQLEMHELSARRIYIVHMSVRSTLM